MYDIYPIYFSKNYLSRSYKVKKCSLKFSEHYSQANKANRHLVSFHNVYSLDYVYSEKLLCIKDITKRLLLLLRSSRTE